MSNLQAVEQALQAVGFASCARHTSQDIGGCRAFEGKFTVRGAVALLVQLGLKRDHARFTGHTNLFTANNDLVTIFEERGNIVVVVTPA